MVFTNFPQGITSQGVPVPSGPSIPVTTGSYWWVNSATGNTGGPGTVDAPYSTLDAAINVAAANDVIIIAAGHAETISAAGGVTADVAGLQIVGLGSGSKRPTFTFSATTSTFIISAAGVSVSNIVGLGSIDAVVSPFSITAASVMLGVPGYPVEWQDPSSSYQAVRAVLGGTGADKLIINLKVIGIITGGTSPVNMIRLNGTDSAIINCDFYGRASTACVEFLTTACTNIEVYGYMYNSGVTNYSKDVVDTATGSTWYAEFDDGAAGIPISGGSASALGPQAAATVIADLAVPTADVTTNALERDVIGNKTDAAVTAVGTTKTIAAYAKGLVTMATVQSADSTANAFAGDVIGNKTDAAVTAVGTTKSIEAYVKGLVTMNTVQSADSTANAFAGDVIGNKVDAAVYVAGTTKSLLAYIKGTANVQENVATTAAAVIAAGTATIFTVAGGPIEVLNIISVCVSANDGTATLLKYTADPTDGGATDLCAASASLASVVAGNIVNITGTVANAAVITTAGTAISQAGRLVVPAGVIQSITSGGATTGTWTHHLRYKPLAKGVTVS